MRCPGCEDKLGTLRTTDYGDKTLRERKCPKCSTNHPTIELFEQGYNAEIKSLKDKITLLECLVNKTESHYSDLISSLERVNRHVDLFKKKGG